jgi:hypothetical protein
VHRRSFAVDRGVRAVAFEHEAQGALRMAMGRRDLARQHELDPGVEIGGDLRLAAQAGILEDEHAALGLLGGDQSARLDHRRANLRERPGRRLAAAGRLGRDQPGERRPQRRHVLLADALVEGQTLRRLGWRTRRRSRHATSRKRLTVYGQYLYCQPVTMVRIGEEQQEAA